METTTTRTPIVVQTIKEFMLSNGLTVSPVVRTNTNGYPFVTFINSANVAENVYFSKTSALSVSAGTPVTKELFKCYQIGNVVNSAGESRIKLIGNSERLTVSDLFD